MISFLKVELFYEICSLASIKSGNYIKSLIVECKSCMEVSSCVEVGNLRPGIRSDIIYLTFIHTFWR